MKHHPLPNCVVALDGGGFENLFSKLHVEGGGVEVMRESCRLVSLVSRASQKEV